MNPIKKFFNNLKAEKKFKEAGPGHRLSEPSRAGSTSYNAASSSDPQSCNARPSPVPLSEAGAAALARVEQKHASQSSVNWSVQATKAQARKELELEIAAKSKLESRMKNVNIQEDNSILTVSGVYFKCPLISPEILPKKEMEEKIKNFLYDQYEDEKGLTACLIIHTLNKNKEKLHVAVETLSRYLTNILDNPDEEKYRKIRFNNKVFQERIVGIEGAFEFLSAAGFSQQVIDGEEYFVFSKSSDDDYENLQMLKDALLSAEPIVPCLDRNLRVLQPAQAAVQINLPNDFFSLSAEEIKREQESKAEAVELMTTLRTKAMRERDEGRDTRIYKYALIRVRFPDGIILQGTFYVQEKLLAVREFLVENLNDASKSFHLLLPGGSKLTDDSLSLMELKLVPAVLLNLLWDDSSRNQSESSLRPEILALLADV